MAQRLSPPIPLPIVWMASVSGFGTIASSVSKVRVSCRQRTKRMADPRLHSLAGKERISRLPHAWQALVARHHGESSAPSAITGASEFLH